MDKIRNMFVVDPVICSFKNGESLVSKYAEKQHPFNINNKDTKDEETGAIIEGNERYYISEVIYYITDERTLESEKIEEFLNYHYQKATNKKGMVNFISCGMWDYITETNIKNPKRLNRLKNWVSSVKDEPTVMVKAWIVYFEKKFEKKGDESVMDSIKRISDIRGWYGSQNSVKNQYDRAKNISLWPDKCTPTEKNHLFTAISFLSGDSKINAEQLYLNLK